MGRKKEVNFEIFLRRAKEKHKDRFEYDRKYFVSMREKVGIICKEHGIFYTLPYQHLKGGWCRECNYQKTSKENSLGTEEFIKRSSKVHNNFYDYSKTVYKNNRTKVVIVCPLHGEFSQRPDGHLNGYGCPKCTPQKISKNSSLTQEKLIQRLEQRFPNQFDYSKVVFKSSKDPIILTCKKHGDFKTQITAPKKIKCKNCFKESRDKKRVEELLEKVEGIFNDRFTLLEIPKDTHTKFKIKCPTHGIFYKSLENLTNSVYGCNSCYKDKIDICKNNTFRYSKRSRFVKNRIDDSCFSSIRKFIYNKKAPPSWNSNFKFSPEDFYIKMRELFEDRMCWENYGGEDGWSIDHRVPLSKFKYESFDNPEFELAWCLDNLQPMWKKDNIRKSNKVGFADQEDIISRLHLIRRSSK